MVKRLFIAVSFVLAYTLVNGIQLSYAQVDQSPQQQAPLLNEKQTIEGSKTKLTPWMLQSELEKNKCTGFKAWLSEIFGLFACENEQYQNINMPSQLVIQGQAGDTVKGMTTGSGSLSDIAASEGEVKGISTIISDIGGLLGFASDALSGKEGGAVRKYFPEALDEKIAQSGDPYTDIPKAVNQTYRMNLPAMLQTSTDIFPFEEQ